MDMVRNTFIILKCIDPNYTLNSRFYIGRCPHHTCSEEVFLQVGVRTDLNDNKTFRFVRTQTDKGKMGN